MSDKSVPGHVGWVTFVCVAVVVAASISVVTLCDPSAGVRLERIDTLTSGPYVLQVETKHGLRYVAWEVTGSNGVPDFVFHWETDPADAWRYAGKDDAHMDAVVYRAKPVALRELVKP